MKVKTARAILEGRRQGDVSDAQKTMEEFIRKKVAIQATEKEIYDKMVSETDWNKLLGDIEATSAEERNAKFDQTKKLLLQRFKDRAASMVKQARQMSYRWTGPSAVTP